MEKKLEVPRIDTTYKVAIYIEGFMFPLGAKLV